jgi:putative methyltransferase
MQTDTQLPMAHARGARRRGDSRRRVNVCQFDGVDVLRTLPLAAGLIVASARADPALRAAFDFAIDTERRAPEIAARCLAGARIAAFSGYSWNWRLSLAVARALRALDPDVFVVLGGPCVPRRPERAAAFLAEHVSVDALVLGEGEIPFRELLSSLLEDRGLDGVPSLVFRGTDGTLVTTPPASRLRDFTSLGSPYLDGTFDALIEHTQPRTEEAHPLHAAIIETNRGCPFTCTFCDWGQAVHTRVHELPLERVHAELAWIARRSLPYLYIADANFGIRPRDLSIVQRLGELRRVHEAPLFCYFHLTKNATERNLATVAALHEAGVGCQVVISMQDTDARVLAAVRRSNITPERALALRGACNDQGIPTLNELLLGLPGQTLASLRTTLTSAVSPYPGDSFFIYPLRVLENAEMGSPEERARHGFVTRAVVTGDHAGIDETEDVVVATTTLPHADWRRAWRFAQVLSAIYNLRLLHLLVHHIRFTRGEDLAAFVDHLLDDLQSARPGSVFASLDDTLERHVRAIESASGLALPVPGYGQTRRGADDAFALTALAHSETFWLEVRATVDRWQPLDAERAELLEYQQFVTTGRGDLPAERIFERDWPAWDAGRGRQAGGPAPVPTRVRRLPPQFAIADATTFAAAWLHAAYAKSNTACIAAMPEATVV